MIIGVTNLKIVKKMKWKINEKVTIKTIRGKDIQNYIMIEKEKDE